MAINIFIIASITFLVPALILLAATIWLYLRTRNFNKDSLELEGRITHHVGILEHGEGKQNILDPANWSGGVVPDHIKTTYSTPQLTSISVKFSLHGQDIEHNVSSDKEQLPLLSQQFPDGQTVKIRILQKTSSENQPAYDVRLLKSGQDYLPYTTPIILGAIASLAFISSFFFFFCYLE